MAPVMLVSPRSARSSGGGGGGGGVHVHKALLASKEQELALEQKVSHSLQEENVLLRRTLDRVASQISEDKEVPEALKERLLASLV